MSERMTMDVDIVCTGFGPAAGGFLTTLERAMAGLPAPPQVLCYERADGLGFGVSGVVTRARGIRGSFPNLDEKQIPMAAKVAGEHVVYLLDPIGASNRPWAVRMADRNLRALGLARDFAWRLPYTPDFLHKGGGLVLSIGQFNQWVGEQLMASGQVQIWPSMPVDAPLIEGDRVTGVRLADQNGEPGMDIHAALTVVADGPVGPVGVALEQRFGVPPGFERNDWAVGSKMVIDLPEGADLQAGTVFHTFGFPEPEIFGFLYVHPDRIASAGIFLPSWFANPVRTSYRYLQHFVQHPYLWRYLEGGKLRSWGAKSLQESGRRAQPKLVGDGWARIGEGSGSTNVLTGSGVDEAWTTGVLLAEGVIELLREQAPFTRENLERAYVQRRRRSWLEEESRIAEHARDGFQRGFVTGMLGMALAGFTRGEMSLGGGRHRAMPSIEEYYRGRIGASEIGRIRRECAGKAQPLHDRLMDRAGWPAIPYDGRLLVTHQDALLLGGKVQALPGYQDHVHFLYPSLCDTCSDRLCIEVCSGEAIRPSEHDGAPLFDREKCVHCGACVWNCNREVPDGTGRRNVVFRAGGGGLHSVEN